MIDSFVWQNYLITAVMIIAIVTLFTIAKKSSTARKLFITATVLYNLVYLVWRTAFTLPLSYGALGIALGVLLLLAEWMGFLQSAVFRFLFWKPYRRGDYPPAEFENPPTVDVLIATYNENIDILRKTILCCLDLDYPKEKLNICLCDDGRRSEAQKLCHELGINYLSREDNEHAKAGNLNHALGSTSGEFVLVLDADMMPKSSFLQKTIGYFAEDEVGFVQTPQVFYNPDPFQYNLKLNNSIPNEQDFFMMDIQSGRDNYNAVLHVGTNAVFRRKALEDIGGIPTGSITEDMATGLLLQAKGYCSVFVREILCTGLSVENFGDLLRQRERWCRGNIQVTKKWNPLTLKGLSAAQRVIYADGVVYWFFGVQKMIYLLCPLLFLLFGASALSASITDLIAWWLPSFIASLLTFRALSKKSRTALWSHIYEVAMAPFLALSALFEAIFARSIPFHVTPKGVRSQKTTFSLRFALPHIALLLLTAAGWLVSGSLLFSDNSAVANSAAVNILWSVYNVFGIIISIFVCVERPRKRQSERLETNEKVTLSLNEGASCAILDISQNGVRVECDDNFDESASDSAAVTMQSPQLDTLSGEVVWTKNSDGKKSFGIELDKSAEADKKIVRYIANKGEGYHETK